MRNARQLKERIEYMEPGEKLHINTVECNRGMIEELRNSLAAGLIQPEEEFLLNICESVRDAYRTGEYLEKDMDYVKVG